MDLLSIGPHFAAVGISGITIESATSLHPIYSTLLRLWNLDLAYLALIDII
jgi:hypothetical protein